MAQLSVLPAMPAAPGRGAGRAADRQDDGGGPRFADVMSRHSRQQERADRPAAGTPSATASTDPARRPEHAAVPNAHSDPTVSGEPEAAAVSGAATDDAPAAAIAAPVPAHAPGPVEGAAVEGAAVEDAAVEDAAVEGAAVDGVVAGSAVPPDADAVVAAVSGAASADAGSPVVATSPANASSPSSAVPQSADGANPSAVAPTPAGSAAPLTGAPTEPSTGPRGAVDPASSSGTTSPDAVPTAAGPGTGGEPSAGATRLESSTLATGSAAAASPPTSTSTPHTPVPAPAVVATPATQSGAAAQAPYTTAAPLPSQLAPRIASVKDLGDGVHRLTLRVQPEAIGAIRVVAEVSGDSVRMELFGGSEAAREALRAALPELRRDLAASGLDARLDLGTPGERQHGAPHHSDVAPGGVLRGAGSTADDADRDVARPGSPSGGLDVIA